MKEQLQNTQKNTVRVEVIDAIRGAAIVMICLLHNMSHYSMNLHPDINTNETILNAFNMQISNVIFYYTDGKAYTIFTLLFGFTFSLQYQSLKKKGIEFGYRFLWRMVILFGFGLINSLLYPGDILIPYAILGIFLFLTRKLNNKLIFIIALFFLLQPIELLTLFSSHFREIAEGGAEIYGKTKEIFAYNVEHGSILDVIKANVTLARLHYMIFDSRTTQTIGMFLLGVLLQRKKLFEISEKSNKFWVYLLVTSALSILYIEATKDAWEFLNNIIFNNLLEMWENLLFTFIIISSFVLLYQNTKVARACSWLHTYGRMSLSNYVSQTYIGVLIYYPIGLGLALKCGPAVSTIIGIIIIAVQLQLCKCWLKKYKQGPLEGLWKKLTWIAKKQ